MGARIVAGVKGRVRFDRNELAGSFGDIGTDLPLLLAIIPAAGLDAANVFVVFGLLQILTGLVYGLPMPMQPLKAMAVIVITQKIAGEVLLGAGLAIAAVMLALSLSGALTWLVRVIPRCVVRGIQLGLGVALATLALKNYLPAMGGHGYALGAVCFFIIVLLWGNRRFPAALVVIGLGLVYAAFAVDGAAVSSGAGLSLPRWHTPTLDAVLTGLVVLALPQLPLSISNSMIATSQTLSDLFPERAISVRRIGVTYAIANVFASLLGGIPVCHGCGGLAGHHAFGARTGGSVVIYGGVYLGLGLFLGGSVEHIVSAFPLPILGVILLFEAAAMMVLVRDIASDTRGLLIAVIVGLLASGVAQGFVIGLLVGTAVFYIWQWRDRARVDQPLPPA